jgi:hypothetical protein
MSEETMHRDAVLFGMTQLDLFEPLETEDDERRYLLKKFLEVRKALHLGGFLWVDIKTYPLLLPEWQALRLEAGQELAHVAKLCDRTVAHLSEPSAFQKEVAVYRQQMMVEGPALVSTQYRLWPKMLESLMDQRWRTTYEWTTLWIEAQAHQPWKAVELFYLSAIVSAGIAYTKRTLDAKG